MPATTTAAMMTEKTTTVPEPSTFPPSSSSTSSSSSSTSRKSTTYVLLVLATLLLAAISPVQGFPPPAGVECFPEGIHISCLRGCLSCWKDFGAEVYDMASCCRKCRQSQAWMIDNGPTQCSLDNTRKSWLKRFGKK